MRCDTVAIDIYRHQRTRLAAGSIAERWIEAAALRIAKGFPIGIGDEILSHQVRDEQRRAAGIADDVADGIACRTGNGGMEFIGYGIRGDHLHEIADLGQGSDRAAAQAIPYPGIGGTGGSSCHRAAADGGKAGWRTQHAEHHGQHLAARR